MTVRVDCPCSHVFEADDSLSGGVTNCPRCGRATDVPGLRGRGETFVGQTETGSLQITVNDDAPFGPQQFLRLLTVGVVEDVPTYYGSCWVPLEIVE